MSKSRLPGKWCWGSQHPCDGCASCSLEGQAHSVRASAVLVASQHACVYFQKAGTYILLQQSINWQVHHRNVENQQNWPSNLIVLIQEEHAALPR